MKLWEVEFYVHNGGDRPIEVADAYSFTTRVRAAKLGDIEGMLLTVAAQLVPVGFEYVEIISATVVG